MITIECSICRSVHSIEADQDDIIKWQQGELIQLAMPYLSNEDRELLISRTCGKCWDKIWKDTDPDSFGESPNADY